MRSTRGASKWQNYKDQYLQLQGYEELQIKSGCRELSAPVFTIAGFFIDRWIGAYASSLLQYV
jgi:hypothetical protein